MQIDDYLDQKKSEIEQALYMHFDTHFAETSVLNRAIKYSVLNGGKRIRPDPMSCHYRKLQSKQARCFTRRPRC